MTVIEFAFKSMLDVVHVAKTVVDEQFARFLGAITTAAYQYHRYAVVFRRGDDSTEDEFTNFALKVRIDNEIRLVYPWNIDRAGGMADEQEFHIGAYVDKRRARLALDQLVGLFGADMFDRVF